MAMASFKSPYARTVSSPGVGEVVLSLLPPGRQTLSTISFQYPLKLIAPDPHLAADEKQVTIVFLLTYGGGLVGGDKINLTIALKDSTRMALLTQGSTKIFKSPTPTVVTKQILNVKIGKHAALCYLPDPTQPFAESVFEQVQTFYVEPGGESSLLMLDWVTEGRRARGESWTLWSWKGRNEVREFDEASKGRLLLRDSVMLHESGLGGSLAQKTNDMGVAGTLIVYGPVFKKLGEYILHEFSSQPRLGAKQWTSDEAHLKPVVEDSASSKIATDGKNGLLWTAASVRGFVLVKFGSTEIDAARQWLGTLLKREGTVENQFGHQALLCLR